MESTAHACWWVRPNYTIPYYQDGKGLCAGLLEEGDEKGSGGVGGVDEEDEATPFEALPARSFCGWARGLQNEPLILISFIIAIPSGA